MGNFVPSEGHGGTPGAHAWPGAQVLVWSLLHASPHQPNRGLSWMIYQPDSLGTQPEPGNLALIRRGPENPVQSNPWHLGQLGRGDKAEHAWARPAAHGPLVVKESSSRGVGHVPHLETGGANTLWSFLCARYPQTDTHRHTHTGESCNKGETCNKGTPPQLPLKDVQKSPIHSTSTNRASSDDLPVW